MNQIRPTIGINEIKFGMTQADVISLCGEPEEIQRDGTTALYYWSQGISYNFDTELNNRLYSIECNSGHDFMGYNLVNLSKNQLIDFCKEKNLKYCEQLDEQGCTQYLDIDSVSVSIWIENDKFDSIQLIVPIDEQENEIWP